MMQVRPDGRWTITWRCRFRSSPSQVFDLLATDEGRRRYWCLQSTQHGSALRMVFATGRVETAELLACRAPTELVLRYFGSVVTIRLQAATGGTDLTLVDDGVDAHEGNEVHAGWLNVLFPLKALADFGIDLRNGDTARSWAQGFLDG